jgi:cell division protein FtsI/penicillin-binding protein 2
MNAIHLGETIHMADYAGLDSIGKSGLEAQYEALLKGQPGNQEVELDARGRTLHTQLRNSARQGTTLHTTLDLAGQQGAVVALDPQNGDVLAAYSAPAFDPNAFVDGLSIAVWTRLRDDLGTPMTNRFLRGSYPPGSTIKPFVALNALHDKAITADQRLAGGAYYQIPGTKHKYYDWKPGGHGAENLREAIRDSNDVYFYQIAMRLGVTQLGNGLAHFGFGQRRGVDLLGQSPDSVARPLDFSPDDLANDLHTIAGKTGTAQIHHAQRSDSGLVLHNTIQLWQDQALFIAYAPADHPRIAVAVVVEHGGHGDRTAGPVARAVIDAYLNTVTAPEVSP